MINNKVCQFCGQEIGPDGPKLIKELGDIPFCDKCYYQIKAHMRRKRPIVLDLLAWAAIQSSPVKLLSKWPEGKRKSTCLYWP